jgi:hypothetical protein
VADALLGDLAGVVVEVVQGAEDVTVAADEVVGELVDQGEAFTAVAGGGRIGDVRVGVLEVHPVAGAQLGGGDLLQWADSDADGLQEAARISGERGALVVAERGGESAGKRRVGVAHPSSSSDA